MSPVEETIWDIEPHTKAKHEILRSYLGAWFAILSSKHTKRIVYVDGFAGPGIYSAGEPGSPIVALTTARDHKHKLTVEIVFWFIESRPDRFKDLQTQIDSMKDSLPSNFRIRPELGEFDERMTETLNSLDASGSMLAPSFVFIDPFGYSDTPMSVIARIMKNPRCEVLVTLMHRDIDRFMSRPEVQHHLDSLFGSDVWKSVLGIRDVEKRRERLREIYAEQLRNCAGVKHVSSFEMRGRNDEHIYCLVHGTNHLKGREEMKKTFWRIDKTGNYRFADRTIPGQSILFGEDLGPCADMVLREFSGRKVAKEEVVEFILDNTPYLRKHFTNIMRELEKANPPSIAVQVEGKRRAYQYPDGKTYITFL